ncbi:MAG: UbiX family flavin prenyltransferase [Proteobacteria bacterium]|nr:UbiX family flavin prenyltransferase [Pseudomonadota bacterium]
MDNPPQNNTPLVSSTCHPKPPARILLVITGASGSLYGEMFLQFLLNNVSSRIYMIASEMAKKVIRFELSTGSQPGSLVRILSGSLLPSEKEQLRIFEDSDLFAPVASGSSVADAMIILPCSMGTVARIAAGTSQSLTERAADVAIKQRKTLIICPRESPLSSLHLRNLLELSQLGAHIVPLMPAMYQKPKSIEDIVRFSIGRVCELLGLEHLFYKPWNNARR